MIHVSDKQLKRLQAFLERILPLYDSQAGQRLTSFLQQAQAEKQLSETQVHEMIGILQQQMLGQTHENSR